MQFQLYHSKSYHDNVTDVATKVVPLHETEQKPIHFDVNVDVCPSPSPPPGG